MSWLLSRIEDKVQDIMCVSGKTPTHILMTLSTHELLSKQLLETTRFPIGEIETVLGLKIIKILNNNLDACSPRIRQSLEEEGVLLLRLPEGF